MSPRQSELLEIVRQLGRAKSSTIAERFGTTRVSTVNALRTLRRYGLVRCPRGRGGLWSLIDTPEPEAQIKDARQRKREWQRAHRQQEFERWCESVTQRVVPAGEAPRVRIAGPVSVFEMAGALHA